MAKRAVKRPTSKRNSKESKDLATQVTETMQKGEYPPEIKEVMYKEWLPRIFAGIMEGVRELPPEHRDRVLMKMSRACAEWTIPVYGLTPCMGWEEYRKHMIGLEPPLGPRKITEIDGIVHHTFILPRNCDGKTICLCPIAALDIIPGSRKVQGDRNPIPELCACSANSLRSFYRYVEGGTKKRVDKVEVLGTCQVNDGADCRFLIYLQPSAFTTPRDEP